MNCVTIMNEIILLAAWINNGVYFQWCLFKIFYFKLQLISFLANELKSKNGSISKKTTTKLEIYDKEMCWFDLIKFKFYCLFSNI